MYPASTAHEALLIVCLFGVVLGGLNLTAVYKPSFYGFALCALVPLIVRVALDGDTVARVHGDRDDGRARVPAGLRPPPQRRADALAGDPVRERRPDRRAAAADAQGRGRPRRRRDREPREEPVPRRGQPRPAPAAARAGALRRRAGDEGARARAEAAGREHPRFGRRARGPVRPAARPVAARCRGAHRRSARSSRCSRCSRGSPTTSRRRPRRTASRCRWCRRRSP